MPSASGGDGSSGDGTDGNPTGDDGFGDDDFEDCDYSLTFDNLDDLNAVSSDMRTDCVAVYALDTLITMM